MFEINPLIHGLEKYSPILLVMFSFYYYFFFCIESFKPDKNPIFLNLLLLVVLLVS